jgi:rubrerythrin
MVTMVGQENSAERLVENCMLLEHDAIAAYDAVIERLSNLEHKAKIESFKADHLQHMEALRGFAQELGVTPPAEGDAKQMLTTGKVKMADMAGGDGAILKAMSTNESDTISAYDHAAKNAALPEKMRPMVEKALADERRHKEWMESAAQAA